MFVLKLLLTASVLLTKDLRHGHFECKSKSSKDLALLLGATLIKTQFLDDVHVDSGCSRHVCGVQLVAHSVLKHQPSPIIAAAKLRQICSIT